MFISFYQDFIWIAKKNKEYRLFNLSESQYEDVIDIKNSKVIPVNHNDKITFIKQISNQKTILLTNDFKDFRGVFSNNQGEVRQ